ncbi:trifunctional transcriptional regulator/proline dehydrogenase/L-glutamate gamma-semialdehyde dehydrogenase [Musicola keenii]|uniref:trifunctional transcriptional regulator/proline dehydrogenase/L-glutamate gamma-semialdehyde dehydrogenase n=1 Tax=Musicola keenii TaxID=2884250 RepID=UPI00178326C7|nr:trifunctional transcriptional regulator/proline dehydrogenase/L-glutamate gamma-semialdehyde dehydrogenase [Musicola keenii]
MGTITMGVTLDEATRDRLHAAAIRLECTPNYLINQAIFSYLAHLESGADTPEISSLAQGQLEAEEIMPQSWEEKTYQPFLGFAQNVLPQSAVRAAITTASRRPETEVVPILLDQARISAELSHRIAVLAGRLVEGLRNVRRHGHGSVVQNLLQAFSLSSQEGVALMCLAESLLRVPDNATRDALIRDKIVKGDWRTRIGPDKSLFINATAWGLLISGNVLAYQDVAGLPGTLRRLIAWGGEPLIRGSVDLAMRLMGEQFVTGETISDALANARRREEMGFRYSYDMLGEAALTATDAQAYLHSYQQAIRAIGNASAGRGIYEGPGISIKLSALHPRYCRAQYERVMTELYPRLLSLVLLARQYDIGINIDAEEADRLEISLDLLEKLCAEPQLAGWNGIGFVVQAYQKRCPLVLDALIDLARRSQRRLMVRLVKGAYWDSEIKRAQVEGLEGYPVYTRKVYTDVAYLACARRLLAEPALIYPQFATHNAHTLSAIYHLAGSNYAPGQYEFQCLHGMGESLYEQVVGKTSDGKLGRPCRVYAPVGTHETLLAYLVRRLLENGANTSFVNRIADLSIPVDVLTADPVSEVDAMAAREGLAGLPHPHIPLPRHLYGSQRRNAFGVDLACEHVLASLSSALLISAASTWQVAPVLAAGSMAITEAQPVCNPADRRDIVGYVRETSPAEIEQALNDATERFAVWRSTPATERAVVLSRAADIMESQRAALMALLVREAGKTLPNALAEVREAVDFLRYYAEQMALLDDQTCYPLGPVVCISPWNFPLAIFTGQVAAALAAGNSVLAKPAEQTPLTAAQVVDILLAAGIPPGVLQLLPGPGESVGAALVRDPRVCGVLFTGSTAVAAQLRQSVAERLGPQGRPIPLIAETGGINAMIVDSSALTQQVVADVIASAFDSAGQRCSALRLLCVQDDVADATLNMLLGAMAECRIGNPDRLTTDIGPLIDADARHRVERHIQAMRAKGRKIYQVSRPTAPEELAVGHFLAPTLIELTGVDDLQQEVFGPVLHVVRYPRERLGEVLAQINALGYGLTMGLHTRIDDTITQVMETANVGNLYINRNLVGAVVGVQPFGGEGLSGTGPKAGGPLYLWRLLSQYPPEIAAGSLLRQGAKDDADLLLREALSGLDAWAQANRREALLDCCRRYDQLTPVGIAQTLPGPTGERNTYRLLPRGRVLCLSENDDDALIQLAAVLAVGCQALWPQSAELQALYLKLPESVQSAIHFCRDWRMEAVCFDAALCHGDAEALQAYGRALAQRGGAIIGMQGLPSGDTNIVLEWLLKERVVSINTTAAGGNASLMTMGQL